MFAETLSDYYASRASADERIARILNANKPTLKSRTCPRCGNEFAIDNRLTKIFCTKRCRRLTLAVNHRKRKRAKRMGQTVN